MFQSQDYTGKPCLGTEKAHPPDVGQGEVGLSWEADAAVAAASLIPGTAAFRSCGEKPFPGLWMRQPPTEFRADVLLDEGPQATLTLHLTSLGAERVLLVSVWGWPGGLLTTGSQKRNVISGLSASLSRGKC